MSELPTRIRTTAEEALAKHFSAFQRGDAMQDVRAAAFDAVMSRGLPHRRMEEWKYTDLRALIRDVPTPAAPAVSAEARAGVAAADVFAGMDRARIVFVNGQFAPASSDLAGIEDDVEFASMGRFLVDGSAILDGPSESQEAPILALNSAFVSDGAVLRLRAGAKLARPLEIAHVFAGAEAGLQTLRHQVAAGAGVEATILQTFSGPAGVAYHTNCVTELRVEDDAWLRWVIAQEEGDAAVHLSMLLPKLGRGVRFEPFSFSAGALVARSELRVAFEDEGSRMDLAGATVAGDRQHIDTTLVVNHAAPRCGGQELFKSAMSGRSQGVFQGKIVVEPGAQKTDSKMMSRALLLSESAEFVNKPELEIFADDVVCGHGATCGQIDREMLFFLRSRGIAREEAQRMLVQAFLAEAIEKIGDAAIVAALEARTSRRLGMAIEGE
jgi:Fe-S cluster assembly protein SufD